MEPAPPWRVLESPDQHAPGARPPESASPRLPWQALGALAAAAVLAVLAFLVAATGPSDSIAFEAEPSGSGPNVAGTAETGGTTAPVRRVLVEVSGAVVSPGVYELPADARVGDAISAAGGLGPRVDAARADRELNLAAPVSDGVEIHVASRDDPAEPAALPASSAPPGSTTGSLVDVNRATSAELEALPGIGPATAAKILAAREEQPFKTVDELRSRKVLGAATFEKVRDLVTVSP
ncbi:MAG TPA: ComEA family DNA-binding protein [Candidatus Limnocylindrales bacterium]|nr:ComEA family DNA-binding protein [Candidatus Limnocylindrales bacterium]